MLSDVMNIDAKSFGRRDVFYLASTLLRIISTTFFTFLNLFFQIYFLVII